MPREMTPELVQACQVVTDMVEAAPLDTINGMSGKGPLPNSDDKTRSYLEVSDRVKSISYFLHMPFVEYRTNTYMNEFVWDPINLRFCTLSASGSVKDRNGSPHQGLARAIGADENYVCGGCIYAPHTINAQTIPDKPRNSLASKGVLRVSEFSGHFGQNWNDAIRAQFRRYMELRTGLVVQNAGFN